ncbi:hypothetical protein RCO48_01430 [Peribacillus frigoritolerans]|nr:hypothetical protein [Peribacillus frigoritolerans]
MIGADVRDSCGKNASRGDPAGESRGGSPTARGKRVPYVPINVQIVQAIKIDKLDFHRVCLQSERPILYDGPLIEQEWIILRNPSPMYIGLHRLHLKTSSGWNS